jgi:peptidoglycan L-alanyl-D-glutamate endopeptidase CwlK
MSPAVARKAQPFGASNDKDVQAQAAVHLSGITDGKISAYTWEHFCRLGGRDTSIDQLLPHLTEAVGSPLNVRLRDVVVDSDINIETAFRALATECPANIVAAQELIRVFYFGDDKQLHTGQILLHHALVNDVQNLFNEVILKLRIPIGPMMPVSQYNWDDYKSMEANNGSGFNFRQIITPAGERKTLSLHALGLALDINPQRNPTYDSAVVEVPDFCGKDSAAGYQSMLPQNGEYDLRYAGTFHDRHPVVTFLQSRGWTWGGAWGFPKDFHHFQKVPAELAAEVKEIRAGKF